MNRAHARPKYFVTDKGTQFWSGAFKKWCKKKIIKPRYGTVGKFGSIAVTERFIKSLKDEFCRRIVVPFRIDDMRKKLSCYVSWYNQHRPHQSLGGRTPIEVYEDQIPANRNDRFEPRKLYSRKSVCAEPQACMNRKAGIGLKLEVEFYKGHKELPIVTLKKAA